jgi:hypothetical protein
MADHDSNALHLTRQGFFSNNQFNVWGGSGSCSSRPPQEEDMKKLRSILGKTTVIANNVFGIGLVLLAAPAFGQGTLQGTPVDNLLHTCAQFCAGPLVGGGSILALGIGGVQHAITHGEHGRNWLLGGAVGLGVAATARYVPAMLGVSWAP